MLTLRSLYAFPPLRRRVVHQSLLELPNHRRILALALKSSKAGASDVPMTTQHLRLGQIFDKSSSFIFRVTKNMRNYEWEREEVETLYTDLVDSMKPSQIKNTHRTYELNQLIVLKEKPKEDYPLNIWEVADGQQRLITLCLLYSALRDSLQDSTHELSKEIQESLIVKNYLQHADLPRITLRECHNGVLLRLLEGQKVPLKDKTRSDKVNHRVVDNYCVLLELIKESSQKHVEHMPFVDTLYRFLQNRVFVYLTIPEDHAVARKLVAISRRGKDAEAIDHLKATCIFMGIEDEKEQEKYLERWVKLEEDFKRSCVQDASLYVAQAHLGRRSKRDGESDLLEDYWREIDTPGSCFFDEVLLPAAEKLYQFRNDMFSTKQTEVRAHLVFLGYITKSVTVAKPIEIAVLALLQSKNEQYIVDNAAILERIGLMFATTEMKISVRFDTVFELCSAIREGKPLVPFDLSSEQRSLILKSLDKAQWGAKTQKRNAIAAVLRRVDASIAFKESESHIDTANASLEHILPQNPQKGSTWNEEWDDAARAHWTHLLGNLCILNIKKNSSCSNLDYEEKRERYNKVIFPTTTNVAKSETWKPNDCEARHNAILVQCKKVFQLA